MSDENPLNAPTNIICIQDVDNLPLVDAHMHIQSNDIAPIPIMMGVAYYGGVKGIRGKRINYHEWSFREFKKIKTEEDDISPTIFTHENFLGKLFVSFAGNDRKSITNRTAGLIASIKVRDYGKVARHTSFNIAGIYMNELLANTMGFASRREIKEPKKYGDPENFIDPAENVNDSEKERDKLITSREGTLGKFQSIVSGYYGIEGANIKGRFDFSIVLGMELMYAHYWGAYGIPIYVFLNNELYYITNDFGFIKPEENGYAATPDTYIWHTAYDLAASSITGRSTFFSETANPISRDNKYKHYLKKVEPLEVVQYEDFSRHLEYTKMAVIKFPLKLLPFYHFDPRRFFGPAINTDFHEFYKDGALVDANGTNEIKGNIETAKPFKYKYSISELKNELFQGGNGTGLFWGIKMYAALGCPPYIYNQKEREKIFLNLIETKKPKPTLDDDGTYSSVLEFYKHCAREKIPITCHCSPQGMTIADPGVYLKEYLKRQSESRYYKDQKVNFPVGKKQFIQGLGLIDDFSSPYSWKIVLKNLKKEGLNLKLCLAHYGGSGFLDGTFYNYNDKDNDNPYCWHKEIGKLINNYNQVYTDISCYTIRKIDKRKPDLFLKEQISTSVYNSYKKSFPVVEKIYKYMPEDGRIRTSSYYLLNSEFPLIIKGNELTNDDKAQVLALRLQVIEDNKKNSPYKEVWKIAENLADDLKEDEKRKNRLRYRMMFGTDWPMSEIDVKGVTNYTACMFVILQLVTKKLGNKWDVWHQFTVINPLRFLGLIEDCEPEEEKEKYSLFCKFDKLETYKTHLEAYCSNNDDDDNNDKIRDVNNNYGINNLQVKQNIKEQYDKLLENFTYNNDIKTPVDIPTAHSPSMRVKGEKDGLLKILGERK